MSVRPVQFICANCAYQETRTEDFPQKWTLMRYPDNGMYWSCPECESFMYPLDYGEDIDPGLTVDPFRLYARCPNAEFCSLSQNYHPLCEKMPMSPRCLYPLHIYIENIESMLERIEGSLAELLASKAKRK